MTGGDSGTLSVGELLNRLSNAEGRLRAARSTFAKDPNAGSEELLARAQEYLAAREAAVNRLDQQPGDSGLTDWQRSILDKLRREDWGHPLQEGGRIVRAIAQALRSSDPTDDDGSDATDRFQEAAEVVDETFGILTMAERIPKVRFTTVPAANLAVRQILTEAAKAYSAGLTSATDLLCRTALEVCLRNSLSVGPDMKLTRLISEGRHAGVILDREMAHQANGKATEVEIAERIRDRGDAWAHGLVELESNGASPELLNHFWDTVSLLEAISIRRPRRR